MSLPNLYLCFGEEILKYFAASACTVITPNSVTVRQHSSKKRVNGLLTSGERFPSLGVSFHFQVSAQVNTAIHALAICRVGHAASMTGAKKTKQDMTQRYNLTGKEKKKHLVGYRVLVGEPLFAWKVFIHCWNNLQYVVMWRQSCRRNKIMLIKKRV